MQQLQWKFHVTKLSWLEGKNKSHYKTVEDEKNPYEDSKQNKIQGIIFKLLAPLM